MILKDRNEQENIKELQNILYETETRITKTLNTLQDDIVLQGKILTRGQIILCLQIQILTSNRWLRSKIIYLTIGTSKNNKTFRNLVQDLKNGGYLKLWKKSFNHPKQKYQLVKPLISLA